MPEPSSPQTRQNGPARGTLDGVTFEVIVHRLRPPQSGGEWLVRCYAAGEHVHSAEGGVSLLGGLNEAHRAMRAWLEENGAYPPDCTQECKDNYLMIHAATGGHPDCICGAEPPA